MIPRMTTVGTLKNYRYDLNKSNNTMAKAMNTVMTERNFNSYKEDPALATRCFQIRRSYMRAASQLTVNDSILSKYNQAWSALDTVSQDLYDSTTFDDASFGAIIRGESDATASGRNALGQALSAKAKSIVQTMNGRHGENYIFGGAETLNVPFTWGPRKNPGYIDLDIEELAPDADPEQYEKYAAAFQYVKPDGGLTNKVEDAAFTRELNDYMDAEIPDDIKQKEETGGMYLTEASELRAYHYTDDNGEYHTVTYYTNTTDDPEKAKIYEKNPEYDPNSKFKYLRADDSGTNEESEAGEGLYYRGVAVDSMDPEDVKKMEYFLNGETKYLDVGLGHKEDNGQAISTTVFDSALQGIYYLGGYGIGEDGLPNNIVSIVDRLGTLLQRCDPDSGAYASDEDKEEALALMKKFEDQKNLYVQRYAEQDAQTSFLRDNSSLLIETTDSLAQQFMGLEDVDPAAAISSYMFARYCYDTALKLGNSILSQSLMDYMNF